MEKRYTFDPKKAQQILDDAGWKAGPDGIRAKDGQKLSLVLATFRSPWSDMAEAMQGQLRAVGMDLLVQKMDSGVYADFTTKGQHNLGATFSTSLDPDGILRLNYQTDVGSKTNKCGLSDPALDAMLIAAAAQPLGSPERRKSYEDIQRRVMDAIPFVGVMTQLRVEAMAAKVSNLKLGPDGLNAGPLNDVRTD